MSLTDPEDVSTVTAASVEFMKLCDRHGLDPEQIIQVAIAVQASAVFELAECDLGHALDLVSRSEKTLRSAVTIMVHEEKGE